MDRDTAQIAAAADELPVAIWLGRVPGGELVYANRELSRILGMDARDDAVRGEYSNKYSVHRRDGTPYLEADMPYERAVRERATCVVDDMVIHRGDGSKVYLRVFVRPMFDGAGTMTHIVEAFTDITREVLAEQARAEGEARLRQAQRMESVGNLAGGVAHDFNNLLATIKILAAQLRGGEHDPQRLATLQQIDQVTASAVQLTQSLLGFARRGRGAANRMSLNEVVEQIGALARRTFDRRITIRVDAAATDGEIIGDAVQIEQVVMNLALNARDAMPAGGTLQLRTRDLRPDETVGGLRLGRGVLLEVTDTGAGIDPTHRDRVFEPYFTTKTSGPVQGTGLGLATAYSVARGHGGAIEMGDHAPCGTVMRIALPAASGPGALVLVIDDEPFARAASLVALRTLGYRAIAAAGGERGVELFREHHADLAAVVLELVTPRLGARDAYLAMREIDGGVPVLLTSSRASDDQAESVLALGAQGFLAKPLEATTLAPVLAAIVRTGASSV